VDKSDPDIAEVSQFNPQSATWTGAAGQRFGNGSFQISSLGSGYALAFQTFDRTKPLQAKAVVDILPAEGSWVGLTLIHNETDYREISLEWYADGLYVEVYAPCWAKQRVAKVSPGGRELVLTYEPAKGWRYAVDGVEVYFEPIDNLNAELVGDPRVGIFWKNHKDRFGPVNATVGPVTVSMPSGVK
jgi:hypothetical protein